MQLRKESLEKKNPGKPDSLITRAIDGLRPFPTSGYKYRKPSKSTANTLNSHGIDKRFFN